MKSKKLSMKSAEEILAKYYNNDGWDISNGITEDARRWEDLRNCAKAYLTKCRLRVLDFIPEIGENILDMASGPIQYPEYLTYSANFKKRYCVDLSKKALDVAKKKIGEHGEYFHGNFLKMEFPNNFFDCVISLHTIYHIDQKQQAEAINKMIEMVKPNRPIIIVYSNPYSLENIIFNPIKYFLKLMINFKNMILKKNQNKNKFYFKPFNLFWWSRFKKKGKIRLKTWRSFSARTQKIFFPNNIIGKFLFEVLYFLEESFPRLSVLLATYPMVIIEKKN